ncbi:Ada metal-binding domain-containing protein [Paraglaciecola sp. 2405UD69-4]|uniref:DNA-3-methyladenine glycosylase 2 family protein n=1 Tax=Paraglaciecola sp. 2405UD69-4 TaxID=3391836 RepID=UPI0039C8C9F7
MHSISYQQARMSRDPRFDGMFFIAVKTTKIFCRSICPANLPHEKNVEYFQHAQQAMDKGYRPCLRCRPDSAPQSYAWKGTDTTIQRAITLIREYNQLNINEITTKLGISDRYLRQLFAQYFGLSPKQYQLFSKVLFAKKLLHQGALPIEEIAIASGFSSARRLQDNFKKVTGLTPSQVRKSKLASNQNIFLKLHFRPPFNWPHMREFLAKRAIEVVELVTPRGYSRSFSINGNQGWFAATYEPNEHCFLLEIDLPKLEDLSAVLCNIERIFDVNAHSYQIQQQLIKSGIPEINVVNGIRLPGVWDTFEAGCRAILGQQISVKAAISILSLLTSTLGAREKDKLYFPTPISIANSDLDFLPIPNSRKQTLRDFAQFMLANPKHSLDAWLTIKGIGPWTVAYAKMRGLSEPDIFLEKDLIITKQLTKYKIESANSTPWRSYLTLQLWSMS